ncbi:nucleotidyl transferase AbiEii/AbiGii toxin family protein [Cupriavidus basilensis]|uniref:nucleotidyl transferase AbiEii/AbiGii toxin family protein n=1 Tax=Cupriavidus basilensis TaxID=68895 RepID=UPI00157B8851|nr:nucleotidyl transferase AbiEii/AbiGii toxin family protein [Cupriavidus basilensis]NUA26366.1 nucleotidyl transferase AbiEii/AbiGii toxin family protein [Cupriavidus basilensis]
MKAITAELKSDIEDAATAGLLNNLPPAVAEKDIHITDALIALSKIRIAHIAHRQERRKGDTRPARVALKSQLVFAGGTCLSKAHGLIERMSEDIDIKVLLEDAPDGYALPKSHSTRKRLRDIQAELEERLTRVGFVFTKIEDKNNPFSNDNRRYYRLAVEYGPQFKDVSGVLRPELKVELIHRPPKLPVEALDMGYLMDRFIPRDTPVRFRMLAISVAETLAEKVLSLLRRCAWKWDGHQRGDSDPALVRHVYDVWRIHAARPDAIEPARAVFAALVAKDVEEFKGQHPGFDTKPYAVLSNALDRARSDEGLRRDFSQRLLPLLFAKERPVFETCFASFAAIAEHFLTTASTTRSGWGSPPPCLPDNKD